MTGTSPKSVVVIGGGLVGLCCAHYLREAGLAVTVLERDRTGSGASRGNAGEIVPLIAQPLPAPGIVSGALRTSYRADSPLYIRPQPRLDLARFLFGFMRNARPEPYLAGARALASLGKDALSLFDELERLGVDADINRAGYLYVFGSEATARSARAMYASMGMDVSDCPILDAAAVRDAQPCLGPRAEAGFVLPNQWSLDPDLFVDRLTETLRAREVSIIEGARATSVTTSNRSGVRVHTTSGTFDADTGVIAAGIWSREISRSLGVDLGIVAGKGYSFSVDVADRPDRVVNLADARVVVTPMSSGVRLAGTMEFDRQHDRFTPGRIASMVAAADPYLCGVDWGSRRNEWVGPRPMTADGLPIIGPLPGRPNVYVASGHNMLGLTLGPSTARLIANQIIGAAPPRSPFEPVGRPRVRPWRRTSR